MSDIVEMLLGLADRHYEMLEDIHIPLSDAAEEIKRLREENERLRAALERIEALECRRALYPSAPLIAGQALGSFQSEKERYAADLRRWRRSGQPEDEFHRLYEQHRKLHSQTGDEG